LKRKSFAHENEVRGLIDWTDFSKMPADLSGITFAEAIRVANPPGIGVSVDLKRLIEQIFISLLAPCYFRDVVEIMSARYGLSERIRASTLIGEPVC
jgi:hypothetical protein